MPVSYFVEPEILEEQAQALEAEIEKLRAAEGKTTEARGAFDPRIEGDAKLVTGAYYDLRSADAELRRAVPETLDAEALRRDVQIGEIATPAA